MAGLVSPATLEQIRAASDIVEVIGGYIPLKRSGANFMALCPFHREKSPSFNVNPQRQIFHCFGCHKGGDVYTFVREYENLSFMEAVRRLAERARIPLEFSEGGEDPARTSHRETLLKIHEEITRRWQTALTQDTAGAVARDYLEKRGLGEDAVREFRLGYAPEAWDDTVNWARSRKFDPELMIESGLVVRKDEGRVYDRFRGRLIFPITDPQGRVIAFSGRLLDPDAKAAKYVNSPETPLFHKGKILFGLDKSKRALLDAQSAILCEGQVDLIRAFTGGIRNVVAPQGTALTPDHARVLKRYVEEVVLCFDSDTAGQNAAVRSWESLLEAGLAVRVATVPAPHDPDSFIREQGPAAFQRLIDDAPGFFEFLLEVLCREADPATERGRRHVLNRMGETVARAHNRVVSESCAQITAVRLGVQPAAVLEEFHRAARSAARREDNRPPAPEEAPNASTATQRLARPRPGELWLIKLLLQEESLANWLILHLDPGWIQHDGVRRLVQSRLDLERAGQWRDLPSLLAGMQDPGLEALCTEAAAVNRPLPQPEKQIVDVVRKLRNEFADRELGQVMKKFAEPDLSNEDLMQLQGYKMDLIAWKQSDLAPLQEDPTETEEPPVTPAA